MAERIKRVVGEFREFAVRGNVIDLAVGIIIGAAFTRIVNSLVEDIVMPPLGLIIGRVDFTHLAIRLGSGDDAPSLRYGNFLNHVLQFVIVAFAVFLLVRAINRLRSKVEPPTEPGKPVTKQCPYCLSDVAPKAIRCPFCTSELQAMA
jgi:large conductance mechanosensitive channel